jgi:hypothetical protein
MSLLKQLYTTVTDDAISINQVYFQQNEAGEILYNGSPIQARLVYIDAGPLLEFTGIPPVSTIDYLRLDHFYHFGRKPTTPHLHKIPKYHDLTMDIYFSPMLYSELRDELETIFKKINADFTTDSIGYNIILQDKDNTLNCRINIFLADDESGYIIEFSHIEREYKLYWGFIQFCLKEMLGEMY